MKRTARKTSRRVTMNLPADLIAAARTYTGKGITETVVEGLEMLRRRKAAEGLAAMAGKLKIEVDLDVSRERARH
jgi:hypothetical protein